MQKITATVTRKWIKDLRANGKSNAEILEGTFERVAALKAEGVHALAETLIADMRLAGLISND